ncbi:MAG: hypothetical protein CL789_04500 [Chloroflexi bacterium]|nr:hypothetical protein [Chloroflexota bacterium]HCU80967.1 hypothetical protein [Chloroflexota bacterium]|tara:strand:+ start:483 stop:1508 length:1026 start_codon:yes stop_codon:yes gene_type:complete
MIVKEDLTRIIKGKTVLVTGASGTVGSEIVSQLSRWFPKQIVCVGRHKDKLHEVIVARSKVHKDVDIILETCDVCDHSRINEVFVTYMPDIVFHMAAEKDIRSTDADPANAVMVNVKGTLNVIAGACEIGSEKLVFSSSIKASQPTSVMGATKRIGEMIVKSAAVNAEKSYYTVRLSNVLESIGGVYALFCRQIENGGPITITHPDAERVFVDAKVTARLLLETLAYGTPGSILALAAGDKIRVIDLAKRLINSYGLIPEDDIAISYVGLRDGERLVEETIAPGKKWKTTSHGEILMSNQPGDAQNVPGFDIIVDELLKIADSQETDKLLHKIRIIVPEYY